MKKLAEQFIREAIAGTCEVPVYEAWFSDNLSSIYPFSNEVALKIARRFLDGRLSFEHADAVANELYALYVAAPIELPQPADSIYRAFDRGEYEIGGEDPVEAHTRPMLSSILTEYDHS
ncbi:MAG: hypothetical protein KJO54_06455 [Gammaproteobacteria bacterium]|nr:hypothetical protein [Gammaproteobacteria bacterium]NNF59940.1 hypothetical protein [Gammaproteobacteria bacterium]NNM19696.1 hypothetical protein [Gammaproteobacteria bacterium]